MGQDLDFFTQDVIKEVRQIMLYIGILGALEEASQLLQKKRKFETSYFPIQSAMKIRIKKSESSSLWRHNLFLLTVTYIKMLMKKKVMRHIRFLRGSLMNLIRIFDLSKKFKSIDM
ncbi:hypothetical protein R6Q59_019063 [Mikania micrantha]